MSRGRRWGEMRRWSWGNGEEAKGGEPKVEAGEGGGGNRGGGG